MAGNLREIKKDEKILEIKDVNEELKKGKKESILKEYEDKLGY